MKRDINFRDIQTGRYELDTKTKEITDKLSATEIMGENRVRLFCNDGNMKVFTRRMVIDYTLYELNKQKLKFNGYVEITYPNSVNKGQYINKEGNVIYFDAYKHMCKRDTELKNNETFVRLIDIRDNLIRVKLETMLNAHFIVNELLKDGYEYIVHDKVIPNMYLIGKDLKIYSIKSHKFLSPSIGEYTYSLNNINGKRSNISAKAILHKMHNCDFKTPWRTGDKNHSTKYDETYVKRVCVLLQNFKGNTTSVIQSLGFKACDDNKQLYNLIYRIKSRKAWKYVSENYAW